MVPNFPITYGSRVYWSQSTVVTIQCNSKIIQVSPILDQPSETEPESRFMELGVGFGLVVKTSAYQCPKSEYLGLISGSTPAPG